MIGPLARRRRPSVRAVWRRGERVAARAMRRAGCRVLERNATAPAGEIDLICEDRRSRAIIFVEVKARWIDDASAPGRIPPEVAITARKRRKLASVARQLVARRGWSDRPLRIDVVAVELRPGRPMVRHYEDAVRPAG